jgi:hypothetical protein
VSKSGEVQRGEYSADFEVIGGMVRVTSIFGTKQTQLGSLPAEVLAGMLLGEQIADEKRRG